MGLSLALSNTYGITNDVSCLSLYVFVTPFECHFFNLH